MGVSMIAVGRERNFADLDARCLWSLLIVGGRGETDCGLAKAKSSSFMEGLSG